MTTTKKVAQTNKAPKTTAPVASKGQAQKHAVAKEVKRGRFDHPEGIKPGEQVTTKVRRGDRMVTVTGTFAYCNRNSVDYAVIKVGKHVVERALSKFQRATRKATEVAATK